MQNKEFNVLSLFDGISCGRVAFERASIHVDNYFSSEVEKSAIKVADANWPEDSKNRLGDVRKIDCSKFPRISVLLGGSPCQSFSFAGKRVGMKTVENIEITSLDQYLTLKNSNFEFQGQSYLFWEYVRVLQETSPKYFLLENVIMPKKWENIITTVLGCQPIEINSSLVSGQNRPRLYWTNIPNVTKPSDKQIFLIDILEKPYDNSLHPLTFSGVTPSTRKNIKEQERDIYPSKNGFFTLKCKSGYARNKVGINKSCTLNTEGMCYVKSGTRTYRKISPIEAERLQTLPDNYTSCIPISKRYHAIGNGWTVDVISHIFKGINNVR